MSITDAVVPASLKKLCVSVPSSQEEMSTFSPSQRKLNHSFSLSFGGQTLIQSNVTKFLEVYLDEHLTWKYHINFVCKQITKSIIILSRTRFYLSCMTKLTVFYTLIYPCIAYCNSTSRGGALGYFLGGYVPPRTPKRHPVLEKIYPQTDTPL